VRLPRASSGPHRRAACLLLGLALWSLAPPARADEPAPSPERAAQAEAAVPGLFEREPSGRVTGVAAAAAKRLLAAIQSGRAGDAEIQALATAYEILSGLPGPVNAFQARRLLSDGVAAAVASGDAATLERVSAVLEGYLDEPTQTYAPLARDLLSQKVRCGAAASGNTALMDRISRRLDAGADGFGATDGTVADRYGLHRAADLFRVAARGERVAAAGYLGSLVVSQDGGRSWSTPATGTDEPLLAVALGPGRELWAVGRNGVVLHSEDGGVTFARRPTPFRRHLFGVLAPGAGRALVVGDFGLQLATSDAGARWACIPRDEDVILNGARPAAGDAALVGEFGTVERMTGLGPPLRRGRLSGVPDDVYLTDVWFSADGRIGVAVGIAGTLLRSTDGGASWAPVSAGFTTDLYGVGGAGDVVAVAGDGGFVAVSHDQGATFARPALPTIPAPLLGVAFASPERGYVVGMRGLVLATRDGGQHFERVR
jgi:photosystem II stability/assembly factor-like uncharacterized protein